jgi:RHS repeat-associated protein
MTMTSQLSENSHRGFEGIKAALYLGSTGVKSNTASELPLRLRPTRIGSRSSGKERDAETGLDNFKKRYLSSPMGRFLSPDPLHIMKQKLIDPQQWNMYAYARNNPLRFMDPTGMYNTDCKTELSKCSKEIQNLDANIKKDLVSKDPAVRLAAAAYGTFNDSNKINIRFDPNAKKPGIMIQDKDDNGNRKDSATITFQGMTKDLAGRGLVAHEGSHVRDFNKFMDGGTKPLLWKTERDAFITQTNTLLDEGSKKAFLTVEGMSLRRPDSKDNYNDFVIDKEILENKYNLFPSTSPYPDWERP